MNRHTGVRTALALAALIVVACTSSSPAAVPSPTAPARTATASQVPSSVPSGQIAAIAEFRSSTSRAGSDSASAEEVAQVVASDAAFAFNLYRELTASEDVDIFLSPYSISTALSMTYAGARGQTAEEMAAVLGIGSDGEAWHRARNALELTLAARSIPPGNGEATPMTLDPTNAIFGQSGYPFEEPFLDTLAADYGAGMHAVDFASAAESARKAINDWVAEQTYDRIPELLKQGDVDDSTAAALVNAIYFKANWIRRFDPEGTHPAPFHLLDGSTIDVPTMHGSAIRTSYVSSDGWRAFRLPYWGASMFVIIPDEGQFAAVESALDPSLVTAFDREPRDVSLTLDLPRWQSDQRVDLIPPLESLGIVDLFDWEKSDLSGITTAEQLFVKTAVHQANVSVDENGTEAAAATAVVPERVSMPELISLSVDMPFIYLISDDATGEILFMGRVLDPR